MSIEFYSSLAQSAIRGRDKEIDRLSAELLRIIHGEAAGESDACKHANVDSA